MVSNLSCILISLKSWLPYISILLNVIILVVHIDIIECHHSCRTYWYYWMSSFLSYILILLNVIILVVHTILLNVIILVVHIDIIECRHSCLAYWVIECHHSWRRGWYYWMAFLSYILILLNVIILSYILIILNVTVLSYILILLNVSWLSYIHIEWMASFLSYKDIIGCHHSCDHWVKRSVSFSASRPIWKIFWKTSCKST